jgi:DNA-binding CsgD family transcriptional regulator
MKKFFSRDLIWICLAAALLIFAIRFFETAFESGRISTKIYITVIGFIFLGVGALAAIQVVKRKTIVQYLDKPSDLRLQPNELLTEREGEILKAIARGLSNREIGAELFVSENTVKKHINNIYFKLDVNRRTQAIARAKELKILTE